MYTIQVTGLSIILSTDPADFIRTIKGINTKNHICFFYQTPTHFLKLVLNASVVSSSVYSPVMSLFPHTAHSVLSAVLCTHFLYSGHSSSHPSHSRCLSCCAILQLHHKGFLFIWISYHSEPTNCLSTAVASYLQLPRAAKVNLGQMPLTRLSC